MSKAQESQTTKAAHMMPGLCFILFITWCFCNFLSFGKLKCQRSEKNKIVSTELFAELISLIRPGWIAWIFHKKCTRGQRWLYMLLCELVNFTSPGRNEYTARNSYHGIILAGPIWSLFRETNTVKTFHARKDTVVSCEDAVKLILMFWPDLKEFFIVRNVDKWINH